MERLNSAGLSRLRAAAEKLGLLCGGGRAMAAGRRAAEKTTLARPPTGERKRTARLGREKEGRKMAGLPAVAIVCNFCFKQGQH